MGRSHRGYVALATSTLALAVGVNLVVFTVVNALWLRPLPFPDADRLVTFPGSRILSLQAETLELFGGHVAGQVITDESFPVPPQIECGVGRPLETLGVTSSYFRLLGLTVRGRDFTENDDRAGAEPVAIISDRLWSGEFGRRAATIGAIVDARPFPLRVIGVAPPGFGGARRGERADLWIPSRLVPRVIPAKVEWSAMPMMVFARLPPGYTAAGVERLLRERNPKLYSPLPSIVVPLREVFGTPSSRTTLVREGQTLAIVGGLALVVLLGGCATLAALVLVHSERRRGEVAVKIALGASRLRLIGERSRELAVVGAGGAAGAVGVALIGLRSLPSLHLPGGINLARLDLSLDWRVLATALVITSTILVVAAWIPVTRFTRSDLAGALCSGTGVTASRASERQRQALLAVQVCAAIVVMVAAGLFVRAVLYGFGKAPGFEAERSVFVAVQLRSPLTDPDPAWARTVPQRLTRITEALRALPGVVAVAEGPPPLSPEASSLLERPITVDADRQHRSLAVGRLDGTASLLPALGIPVLTGRALTEADAGVNPVPAVITASLARRLWPTDSAVGRVISTSLRDGRFVVVGTASDFVFGSLADPAPGVIVTARRIPMVPARFVVRANVAPQRLVEPIRRAVREAVPDAAWVEVATGREVVARDLGRQRLGAWFFSGFGLTALLLGVGGVFGLVAYLAETRKREHGVRLALGATTADLLRCGVSVALVPVSVGVAVGLCCAGVVARLFTALLVGLSALDPLTYVAVAATMLGAALTAAMAAAYRVRGVSPSDVLRAN